MPRPNLPSKPRFSSPTRRFVPDKLTTIAAGHKESVAPAEGQRELNLNVTNRTAEIESPVPTKTAISLPADTEDDSHWPVVARDLLTKRERSMFQRLVAVYPDHTVFAQVALSQLLDVPLDTPDRQSIRNRFSQLVADFVLCRADLSIVAVIELDDSSHARPDRQYADARKSKAIQDAGLRIIRIAPGPIPSEAHLRELLQNEDECLDQRFMLNRALHPMMSELDSTRRAGDHSDDSDLPPVRSDRRTPMAGPEGDALFEKIRNLILGGALIAGGWVVYSHLLSVSVTSALRPQPIEVAQRPAPMTPALVPHTPSSATAVANGARQTAEEQVEKKRMEAQAALAAQRTADALAQRIEQAWTAYYVAPVSCEHPPTWKDQVECGNEYMRAKKQFAQAWQRQQTSTSNSTSETKR
jgi:Protein of unknown function (DUF2726)